MSKWTSLGSDTEDLDTDEWDDDWEDEEDECVEPNPERLMFYMSGLDATKPLTLVLQIPMGGSAVDGKAAIQGLSIKYKYDPQVWIDHQDSFDPGDYEHDPDVLHGALMEATCPQFNGLETEIVVTSFLNWHPTILKALVRKCASRDQIIKLHVLDSIRELADGRRSEVDWRMELVPEENKLVVRYGRKLPGFYLLNSFTRT